MKQFLFIIFLTVFTMSTMTSCKENAKWSDKLEETLPYLGHRNWIVVTDMAYPLQSGDGVTTLYADEDYVEVLKKVKKMIDAQPHVFAHVWNDKEFGYITEDMVSGIDELKDKISAACGGEAQSVMHEDLIKRLDAAGKLYQVTIIKTNLTIPYSSTFFELDCGYWNAEKQELLDKKMK